MKKTLILAAAALVLSAFAFAAIAQGAPPAKVPAAEKKASAKAEKAYVCEMSCEVSDKPGKCSKCGMNLKEVNKSDISYVCACPGKDGKPAACCKSTSDKPGKCKCGVDMKLTVKPAARPAKS